MDANERESPAGENIFASIRVHLRLKNNPFPKPLMATKNTKKASSHTVVSRALISAANRFPGKYDFADKQTAAPIGALLMIANTQRSSCVFCGNWIVGLSESRHREIVRKRINFQG
jgi:hypothetical protein